MDQTNPTPSSLNAGENACVCSPPLGMGEQAAVAAAPPPPQTCRADSPGSPRGQGPSARLLPPLPDLQQAELRAGKSPRMLKKLPGTLEIAQSNLCSAFPMQRGPRLQHASQPGKQAHSHRPRALGQPPGVGGGPSRPHAPSTQGLICISNVSQTSPYFPLQLLAAAHDLSISLNNQD